MAEGGKQEETPTKTITVSNSGKKDKQKVVLKLTKSANESGRKVQWDQNTVDNEFMNKKKSKCCCIYTKPRAFGESDSESDDEDDESCTHHCRGHCTKDYKNVETYEEAKTELENPSNHHQQDSESSNDRVSKYKDAQSK